MAKKKNIKENKENGVVGANESKKLKTLDQIMASEKKPRPAKLLKREIKMMEQVDGKNYNKSGAASIDELLGTRLNKYQTTDEKEYEAQLERMNVSDLQTHASSLGILPNHDRAVLTKRLLKEFRFATAEYLVQDKGVIPYHKKPSQAVLDILAGGR